MIYLVKGVTDQNGSFIETLVQHILLQWDKGGKTASCVDVLEFET